MDDNKWSWWTPAKGEIIVDNNHIYIKGGAESSYYPFDFINLPNAFAKIDNVQSAIDFIEKYGYLGYYAINDNSYETSAKGDPIDWILTSAKTVRLTLYLIKAIQENDSEKIMTVLDSAAITVPYKLFSGLSDGDKPKAILLVKGQNTITVSYNRDIWLYDPLTHAKNLINDLINDNTKGIRRRIVIKKRKTKDEIFKPIPQYSANALIEVVWHLIGDAYLLSFENEGKGIRTCEECGLPFIVTDNRQKFCPGDQFSKSSICGNKNRVRNYRKLKKNKE